MEAQQKPGWHDRGYLPHFEANTLVQHVVLRTYNSIPSSILAKAGRLPTSEGSRLLDVWLDQSPHGRIFSDEDCAAAMETCLRFFDGDRYDLQAWCIMPTHVRVLLVTDPYVRIGQCVSSWKCAANRLFKRRLGQAGPFFAKDYFDRFCRSARQVGATISYIEANPVKAGLCLDATDWPWSSAFARSKGWGPRRDRLPLFIELERDAIARSIHKRL